MFDDDDDKRGIVGPFEDEEIWPAKVGYSGATVEEQEAGERYWNSLTEAQKQQAQDEFDRISGRK